MEGLLKNAWNVVMCTIITTLTNYSSMMVDHEVKVSQYPVVLYNPLFQVLLCQMDLKQALQNAH